MSSNNEKMLHPYFTTVFVNTVRSLMVNPPDTFGHSGSWDTIKFPEGYEKPDKELFEQRFICNFREKGFEILRDKRNELLTVSDWTDQYEIKEWTEYRQALRDLPSTTKDPENPIWPEPPQVKITTTGSTTRTQFEDDLQTARTQLEAEKTENEITRLKLANAENRISILEQSLSSIISKLNI